MAAATPCQLLPNPSTGNITALRFVQEDSTRDSRPNRYRVEYLDHASVGECLTYLHAQLGERSRAAGLPQQLLDELAGVLAAEQAAHNRLQEWCRRAWQVSPNPGLRLLIRETVQFLRSYLACGGLIGQTFEIDGARAREGLLLNVSEDDLQKLSFDRLMTPLPAMDRKPDQLTPEQLRASFSLIGRVEAEVRLPKYVWDLSDLRGSNEFVLLDFPGLGAAGSGARDTYLCLRELQEVQTILVLISAYHPGGREALDIFDMMQQKRGSTVKDCVLVSISRFDQLPLNSAGGLEALEHLTGSDAGDLGLSLGLAALTDIRGPAASEPVTEQSACEQVRVLREVVTRARDLTEQPDRVTIFSAVRALAHLQSLAPADHAFGEPTFLRELEAKKVEAAGHVGLWKNLSDKLRENEKQEGLGTWLADYCGDGGRDRLLRLLRRHVATHGMRQLRTAVAEIASQTEVAVQALLAAAMPSSPETAPLSADAGRLDHLINQVVEIYRGFAEELRNAPPDLKLGPEGLLEVHRAVCTQFKLNVPPIDFDGRDDRTVYELTRDEVSRITYGWDQWQRLRQQMSGGRIAIPPASGPPPENNLGSLIEGWDEEMFKTESLPQRTEDFLEPFQTSLTRCEWFARLGVQHGIAGLFRSLDRALATIRDDLRPLWSEGRPAQVAQRGGREAQAALALLRSAVELRDLRANFVKEFSDKQGEAFLQKVTAENVPVSLTGTARQAFPLAQPLGRHPVGRVLPWASLPGAPRAANHQVLMLHLRNALAASAMQLSSQLVSQLSQQVIARLRAYCQEIVRVIGIARSKPSVRLALTTSPVSADPVAADQDTPYATLARIQRPQIA